ncbi:MAG: tetratricopeptide repeat protein [Pseudomonadota bacterium]
MEESTSTKILLRSKDFESLERRYQAQGDWSKLAALYQESVHQGIDQRLAVQRLLKAGVLLRDKLKRPKEAVRCFDAVVGMHRGWIDSEKGNVPKSDHFCELGKIYMEVIRNPEKAVESYVQAFELDPSKTHLMTVLGEIYQGKVGWPEVISQARAEAGSAEDVKLKAKFLEEIADIYTFILSDSERAMKMYREILKLDPSNRKALEALESHLIKGKHWSELAEFYLDLKARAANNDEVISILTRLGLIYRDKLNEPMEAARTYEEILGRQPNNFRIAAKLAQLKEDKDVWKQAISLLEETARKAKSATERVPILLRQATIAETFLDDRTLAGERIAEALGQAPAHPEALTRAVALWSSRNAFADVADAYDRAAREAGPAQIRIDALKRLVQVALDKLNEPTRAVSALEAVLREAPNDAPSRDQLLALYESLKMWGPLERFLTSALPALSQENRKPLLLRLASLKEHSLADPAGATAAYEQLLEFDAGSPEALEALERLYPAQRRWNDLINVYEIRAEQLRAHADQAKLYLAQARIFEEKIGDMAQAAKAYERVLLLLDDPTPVFARVEQIYFNEKLWPNLAALYRRSLAKIRAPEEQTRILFKMAELYEQKLGQVDNARACLESVLERAPKDLPALRKLERIFEERQQWPQLIEIYRKEFEATADPSEKVPVYLKAGELFLRKLNDNKRAEECFLRVLELEPENRVSLEFLTDFYRQSNRHEDLLLLLKNQIQLTKEAQPKARLYFEMGRLLERSVRREQEAVASYESALALDPTHEEARRSVADLYRKEQRWADLAKTFMGELEHTRDRLRGARLAKEIASLYASRLDQHDKAIEYYTRAWELNNADTDVLRRLIAAYEHLGDLKAALPHYERLFGSTQADPERAQLCLRIGELYRTLHQDPKREAEWYERTFSFDPSNVTALERLRKSYAELENWSGLLTIYERLLLGIQGLPAARLHYQIGEIYETQLGQSDRAVMAYQVASELDPSFVEPLKAMRRLLQREENWGEYLKTAQAEAQLTQDPAARTALLFEIGHLWRNNFLQIDRAIASFEEALRLTPEHAAALEQLSELFLERKNPEAAYRVTQKALAVISEPDRRKLLLTRLGNLELDWRKNTDGAARAFRELLSLEPRNVTAMDRLADVAALGKDFKGELSALQMRLEVEESRERKAALLFRMAEIWKGPLASPSNAAEALNALLKLDPANAKALSLLGEVIPNQEQWKRVAENILSELSRTKAVETFLRASRSISAVYATRLKQPREAIRVLRNALEGHGDREDVLDDLIPLYELTGEHLAAADASLRRAKLLKSPKDRARALFGVARLWADTLENPVAAISALKEALDLDPERAEVLDRLLELELKVENWKGADELLSKVLKKADLNSKRMQELTFRRAFLSADHLGNPDEAVTLLERLVAAAPDHRPALARLSALYEARKDWQSIARHMGHLADLLHGGEAVELKTRLARLYETELKDLSRALAEYEGILKIEPRNRDALSKIAHVHEVRRDFDALVGALQLQVPFAQTPAELASIYKRLGHVFRDQLKDLKRTIEFFERSLEQDPTQADLSDFLASRFREEKRFVELSEVLERRAAHVPPEEATRIYLELSEIWNTSLQNPIRSLEFLDRVRTLDPSNVPALTKSAEIHSKNENFRALAAVYQELARVSPTPQDRLSALVQLGNLQMDSLASPHEAVETYRKVLSVDPNHDGALARLRSLFGRDGRWSDLTGILKVLIKNAKGGEPRSLLRELARIELDRLRQPAQAVRTLTFLYQMAPDEDVFAELSKLHESQGDFEDLAKLLESRRKALAKDPSHLAPVLKQLGGLYDERLGETKKAVSCYEDFLASAPNDLETLSRLEALYRKLNRREDAARILEQRASLLPHGADRSTLLESLATQFRTQKRLQDAVRCLRQLAQDPAEKAGALERIVDVYEQGSFPKELSETLRELLPELKEPHRRVPRLVQLARLLEGGDETAAEAERMLRQACKEVPHDAAAVEALKGFYVRRKDWKKAAALLEDELEAQKDPRNKTPLLRELAEIYGGPLKSEERAAKLYEELIRIVPHEMNAITVLAEIYFKKGSWSEAAPLFDRLVKVSASKKDPRGAATLFFKLGTVMRNLGRTEESLIQFNQALAYDNEHVGCLRALADLYFQLGQWNNALLMLKRVLALGKSEDKPFLEQNYYKLLQTLEYLNQTDEAFRVFAQARPYIQDHLASQKLLANLFFRNERWEDAYSTFHRVLALSPSATDQILAHLSLASIEFKQKGNPQAAREHLGALFKVEENHKNGLELYLELCEAEKDWPEAIQTLEQLVSLERDPASLSRLYYRLGQILDRESGDLRKAKDYYLRSIELGPGRTEAAQALQQFCKTQEDWRELADAYEKLAGKLKRKGSLKQAANFQLALGILLVDQLNDLPRGVQALRNALEFEPEFEPALQALARVLARSPASQGEAGALYERLVSRAPSEPSYLREAADLFERVHETDRSFVFKSILAAQNAASESELAYLEAHSLKPLLPAKGATDLSALEALLPEEMVSTTARLFFETGESLIPIYTSRNQAESMLSATEVVPEHTVDDFEEIAKTLALDLKKSSLIFSTSVAETKLEFTFPATLAVGPGLYKLRRPVQRFVLAYQLVAIRLGYRVLRTLPVEDAEDLLDALYAMAQNRKPRREGSEAILTALRNQTPKKSLQAITQVLADSDRKAVVPVSRLIRAFEMANLRWASLFTPDLTASLEGTKHLEGARTEDLLSFFISDSYLSWRKKRLS